MVALHGLRRGDTRVRTMNERITDEAGRYVAPAQSWPESPPERPRTANVTVREHNGREWTIHGVQLVMGTGDGAVICRNRDSHQKVSACRLEIEGNWAWSEDEAYAEYQRRSAAA